MTDLVAQGRERALRLRCHEPFRACKRFRRFDRQGRRAFVADEDEQVGLGWMEADQLQRVLA